MNKYHIRIDGVQSKDSYTYQELVDMGLFELDKNGIEVKNTTNKIFKPIKSFYFPECQSNDTSYYIDEYGQIHRKATSSSGANNGSYIDEYGQIVRPNNPTSSTTSSSTSASSGTGSNSSPSSSSSSSNDDNDILWRIIATIIVLVVGIFIIANVEEGFWGYAISTVVVVVFYWIWDL